jgi:hypothetical protein
MTTESRDICERLAEGIGHEEGAAIDGEKLMDEAAEEIKALRKTCRAMAREIERMKLSLDAAIEQAELWKERFRKSPVVL